MKCFIVLLLSVVGCVLAQNYNDGRYYPELYAAKFDDGKWRPDNTGSYRLGGRTKESGNTSGVGSRFGSTSGIGSVSSVGSGVSGTGAFGSSFGAGSTTGFNSASASGSFTGTKSSKSNFGDSSAASSIGIKEDTRQLNGDGSYYYRVLNENNIEISETGRVDNAGTDDEVMRVKGYYEYIGDDGVLYRVDYVADENGFQPTGTHLPTPPPIPEAILKSLQQRGLVRK